MIKAMLEIRLNYLYGHLSALLLISQSLFLLVIAVIGEGPETKLPQQRLNVLLKCLHEVSVVKVKNFLDEIASENTDDPDLLILHESHWPLIKTITTKSL